MSTLKFVYAANIIVAGCIGVVSLFFPRTAAATIFSNAYQPSEIMRLVGCLWLAIAILSLLGLFDPVLFSPVLLIQLIYKGAWLIIVALPAVKMNKPYPGGMALFFLVWVMVLPFVIPWHEWLK